MAPQELVAALLKMDEKQGQQLLQTQLPAIDDASLNLLVELIKREADRQWAKESGLSFRLAGHLMLIGDTIQDKYVHALGLMTRGDALRRMDRDQAALPFLDAARAEFLEIGDEVSWARTRIGRVSACLQLNRTSEALRDAADAREVFIRYGKHLRAGQIDVNAAIINYESGQYDQALRLFDRAIETYALQGEGVELYIARAKGNKAIILAAMGRFREAVALHEQARATFASHEGQEVSVARQELNIAQIYASQGHYSHALMLFNRSRAIFQRHAMQFQAAEVAQQTCLCLLRLNRTQEVYELAGETVSYFRKSPGHRHNLAHSLMYQAEAATLEGDYRDADEKLQEASIILEEIGFTSLASIVRLQQAELYFADGKLEDSLREARHVADAFAEQEALPQQARVSLLQACIAANLGVQKAPSIFVIRRLILRKARIYWTSSIVVIIFLGKLLSIMVTLKQQQVIIIVLYAGAASLLPTLWKVDDASSAELMEMFYQALLSDYGKAAALAGAQRAFLARARTSILPYRAHPYFWAGFHLIGDPGPL